MRYQLAVSPINWRNDDMPDLGQENTVDKFFSEAKQAGYAGVEMGAQFPKQADALQALMAPYGLRLAGGWYDMGLLTRDARTEFDAMEQHCQLLLGMGCKLVIVAETIGSSAHSDINRPLSARHVMTRDEWRTFLTRLEELARRTADLGLPLSFHAHMGTVIQSAEDIDRLMNETRHTNLLFDTGHLHYAGAQPLDIFRHYADRINHIHLKDIRQEAIDLVRREDRSFLEGVLNGTFTVPNDGDLDFAPILKVIDASDYQGWLVVEAEQDPDKAPPAPLALAARNYICELLKI